MSEQGPWFGLYCGVTRKVRLALGEIAKDVLVELCSYANGLGVCWPGYRRLGDDTGHAVESIEVAIEMLMNAAYIRAHYRFSAIKNEWEFEAYQISPCILAIQPKNQLAAEMLWNAELRNIPAGFVRKESQPPPEPHPASTARDLPQLSTTTTHDQSPLKVVSGELVESGENANAKTNANAENKTPAARQRRTATPQGVRTPTPRSARPPSPPRRESPFKLPLPHRADERLANRLHKQISGLRLATARRLIAEHGRPKIGTAIVYMANRKEAGEEILNPAGFLVHVLEQESIVPGSERYSSQYLAAKWSMNSWRRQRAKFYSSNPFGKAVNQ